MSVQAASGSLGSQFARGVLRFDHRNLWFAVGRSTIALATIVEICFTTSTSLFHPVAGVAGPHCETIRVVSIYCLGGPSSATGLKHWALIAILAVVASGFRPRFLGLPHAWATFSISDSLTLPDGGDAIALITVLLLIPLCLIDGRRWHWTAPTAVMSTDFRAIGFVTSWALRLQVAYIYFDSAISKMGVPEWSEGTAFYYIVRDKMFGAAGLFDSFWWWMSKTALGTLSVTWGSIILELVIAICCCAGANWRKLGLWSAIFLHLCIVFACGLVTFSLVMIGVAVLVANPDRRLIHLKRISHAGTARPGLTKST
jgi:antimicrobial peptide system SdpB family protein